MKKLLSLLLAGVLLVSLIGAAGAAFTDEASISQYDTEAVEILSDLKVVTGFPDGSFKPEDPLTRAQAAKILCTLLLGTKKADALAAGEANFSDVPAAHWANKYVAYCASNKIVSGVGEGKFDPNGKLTCPAFGKMLLVALGADAAKLSGSGWADAVFAQLKEKHLNYGVALEDKPLDRQSACRLALNALFDGEKESTEGTLAFKTFGVKRNTKGTDDSFMKRPLVTYSSAESDAYWKGKDLTVTASPLYIKDSGAITGGEGVEIFGVKDIVKTEMKVRRNGVNGNVKNDVFTDIWHAGNTEPYYLSGNGIRLEFYAAMPKQTFTVLHGSTFCGYIESVKEPTYYADGTVAEPGSIQMLTPPTGIVNLSLYVQTNDFRASDVGSYCLYWGPGGSDGWTQCTKVQKLSRGNVVTGKLTAQEPDKSVTIDGKTYTYPEKQFRAADAERYLRSGSLGDTVHALLDDCGNCYAIWK